MKVSRDRPVKVKAYVATGDGTDEFFILQAIAEKYNGDKGLFFPKTPSRASERKGVTAKRVGLSIIDDITDIIKEYQGIKVFLL